MRFFVVTARIFALPVFSAAIATGTEPNTMSTLPAYRSFIAGPLPL